MDVFDFHAQHRGKIGTKILTPIQDRDDLSLAYTPGVAAVGRAIADDPATVWDYTV